MKRWCLLIAIIGLLVAIGVTGFRANRGPTYQGRSLSSWLADYGQYPIGGGLVHDKFSPGRRQTRGSSPTTAIRAMGTNAIGPLLFEIKRGDDSPWLATIRRLLTKQKWIKLRLPDVRSRREQAALAFYELGPAGIPALPELAQLLTNYSTAVYAAHALVGLGTNAIPAYTSALTNSNTWITDCGAWGLAQCGPESSGAVPQILAQLQKGNNADTMLILWALSEIHEPTDVIRTVLLNHLDHSDPGVRNSAAKGLSKLGADAKPARVEIEAALDRESDQNVRDALRKLIKELDEDGLEFRAPADLNPLHP